MLQPYEAHRPELSGSCNGAVALLRRRHRSGADALGWLLAWQKNPAALCSGKLHSWPTLEGSPAVAAGARPISLHPAGPAAPAMMEGRSPSSGGSSLTTMPSADTLELAPGIIRSLACTLGCSKVLKVQSAILSSKRIGGNFPKHSRVGASSPERPRQVPLPPERPARPSRSPVPGVHASLKGGSLQVATLLRYTSVPQPHENCTQQMRGLLSARGRSSKASIS